MHAGADNGGGDSGGEVAVADQPDARSGGANIGNQFLVARAVEHDHDQVFHVAIQSLRDILQIVGHGSVEFDRVLAREGPTTIFSM